MNKKEKEHDDSHKRMIITSFGKILNKVFGKTNFKILYSRKFDCLWLIDRKHRSKNNDMNFNILPIIIPDFSQHTEEGMTKILIRYRDQIENKTKELLDKDKLHQTLFFTDYSPTYEYQTNYPLEINRILKELEKLLFSLFIKQDFDKCIEISKITQEKRDTHRYLLENCEFALKIQSLFKTLIIEYIPHRNSIIIVDPLNEYQIIAEFTIRFCERIPEQSWKEYARKTEDILIYLREIKKTHKNVVFSKIHCA